MMRLPLLIGLAAAALVSSVNAQDAAPRLAPHRAVYDLALDRSAGARTIESARGRIAFDFTGDACEGYVLKFRQVTELMSGESGAKLSDLRTANFESGDGRSFRFRNETGAGGPAVSTIDGTADRKGGGPLAVQLKSPKRESAALDSGAVFPNVQMRDLIAAARRGDTTLQVKVFDGSDDGKTIYDTLSVIGKRVAPGETAGLEEPARQDGLAKLARWPVTMSYFKGGKADGTPVYTLSFDVYENGVSRNLKLDYGDFALRGVLSRLELLPDKGCSR